MNQKPTIGRIVLFQPTVPGAEVVPAVITRVWSDTCVNLHVFGSQLPEEAQGMLPTSVIESMGGPGTPRTWFWPPRA